MSTGAHKRWTVQDYLDFERQSDTKHEFFDGELFAMAGGKRPHSLIGMNIASEIRFGVKSRNCEVHGSDMKVYCPTGLYTYPDVSVVCGEAQMQDDQEDVLLNPLVIVEVLSKSTESYDRGQKFTNYKSIESLRDYILVAQDKAAIDHFTKGADNQWHQTTVTNPAGTLELSSLECKIPLNEIYRGVEIPAHN